MTAIAKSTVFEPTSAEQRIQKYDWSAIGSDLDASGCAVLPKLMSPAECAEVASLYPHEQHFRSHIHMARHGFGKGEYRYFKYPLPELIGDLRTALYTRVAPLANAWNERMNIATRYPKLHADYLNACHKAGQTRPTPLLLQYVAGDFNCLHQDLYGDLAIPVADYGPAVGAERRFHRRRVCAHRAAPAHAKPRRGRAAATGRRRTVCGP